MLLKITYIGENSTDLGFLLHKNPYRPQEFNLTYGKAYVFYPLVSKEKTTAALLLDINPIDLARGKLGSRDGGLFDYVNDRIYAATSFLSSAISRVFSSALSGKCDKRSDLVKEKLDLEAEISMLPCYGGFDIINKVFSPLGYEIEYFSYMLDEKFPKWGNSKYVTLHLKNKITLSTLLNHLYLLIPVFDNKKHYWFNEDEINKLINHGGDWLNNHPEKEMIISRYLNYKKSLINSAKSSLLWEEDEIEVEDIKQVERLNDIRLSTIIKTIEELNPTTVLDLGCGEGKLISKLLKNNNIRTITGIDVSIKALEKASSRLKLDRINEKFANKVQLLQGSITYKDNRFKGYDCVCVIEVIEHLDIDRLDAFERVLFEFAAPKSIIITTPNIEYNKLYESMEQNEFRHVDHRFEWTREEFQAWANNIAKKYNYQVSFSGIGEADSSYGEPTQMGVFKK